MLSSQTIYSGTNRITNFNCKIDFVQLLRRLRPYVPSTPPARSELRLVRGFTKLSLRRRRTVSAVERETHLAGLSLLPRRYKIARRELLPENGSLEVRAVRYNERDRVIVTCCCSFLIDPNLTNEAASSNLARLARRTSSLTNCLSAPPF